MKKLSGIILFCVMFSIVFNSYAASAPQNFSASVSGNTVSFSWVPSPASGTCAGDPCVFKRYMLQQSGVGNFISVSSNRATNSFTLTGIPNGQYTFTLRAYYTISEDDSANYATPAVPVTVGGSVPPTPQNVNAVVNSSTIDLEWPVSTSATTYEIQRNSADLASVGLTKYKDTSASAGVSYTYRVRACNTIGCSGWSISSPVTIPPVPAVPGDIKAVPGSSSIAVSWYRSTSATTYELQRNAAALLSVTTTSYTDSTVAINTAYVYRVRACNATGCSAWGASPEAILVQKTAYVYDALGRLVGVKQNDVVKEGYLYDKAGNRCSVSTTAISIDQNCP